MRMTDEQIQKVFDDYNRIRAKESYWIAAGLALVDYLHTQHGMRHADIYAIAEGTELAKSAKAHLESVRTDGNVVYLATGTLNGSKTPPE